MTADALKKITTDALDTRAALLDEGHSDRLTALLKTIYGADPQVFLAPSVRIWR